MDTQDIKNDQSGIIETVVEEIKRNNQSQKDLYTELRKNVEEVRHLVDENSKDYLAKETIDKLTADITARQAELDGKSEAVEKKLNERLDAVEVSMKRPGGLSGQDADAEYKDAHSFFTTTHAVKSKDETGASFRRMRNVDIDIDAFKKYKENFETYIRIDEKYMSGDETKALLVGSDPDGGYTVTPAMSNTIIKKQFETDPMRQLASVENISTGAIEWLVDWDEAGSGWESETVAVSETATPQFQKKRIPVHVHAARPTATQTLLEDSGINIENWLAKKMADKFGRTEAASFVTGNGIGKPRGFLDYANGTNYGQVEQINMGATAALTADGFYNVKYGLIEQFLNRGTWLMNRTTVAAALKLKDGMGAYIWSPGLREDSFSTLLGLPVRMSTTMPAVAADALSVALADWREAYMIVDRLGITVQRDPFTKKPFVEFYSRKRVGGDVVNYQAIKIGKVAS